MRCWIPLIVLLLSLIFIPTIKADQPNIVIIYTDDFGYGDVGCYEGANVKTPNIDRLAKEGIKFTDAHCSAATCTPSRYTLLTGSYAFRNERARILAGSAGLIIDPKLDTLPRVLGNAGYKTAVVGKWHLGLGEGDVDWNGKVAPGPNEVGFDYHFLIPATGDRTPCVYLEQHRVVDLDPNDPIQVSYGKRIDFSPSGKEARDTLKMDWSHGHNSTIVNGISRIGWMTGGKKTRWVDEDMADRITEKAVDFIRQYKEKPFFLYFSTHDIHVPRVPHARFVGKSGMGPRGDCIIQTDWCVGQLLDTLDEMKLADNTLVLFASDNGPVLDDGYKDDANEKLGSHDPNGPYRAGKYSLFEGGTRTPFLARFPGRIEPGTTSAALLGQVDLPTTIAKLCDAKIPNSAFPDSRDATSTLFGKDKTGRPHLVHEVRGAQGLRLGQWKYVPKSTHDNLGPWINAKIPAGGALYDLSNDIAERKNLSQKEPAKLQELKDRLAKIRKSGDKE